MPKKIYMSREQIAAYVATQAGACHSSAKNAYFRQCDRVVYEQSIGLIEDFLNDRIEIESNAVKEIENLIYTVKYGANTRLSLQMQKALHRLQQKKIALAEKQKRLNKLTQIQNISLVLNNKKQAAALTPGELNIIKKTLDKQQNNAIIKRLREKAQSYALLCYSSLKNSQELNLHNPAHKQFIDNYNLRHIHITQTAKTQLVQPKQPRGKVSEKFTIAGFLSQNFKKLNNKTHHKLKHFEHTIRRQIHKAKNFAVLAAITAGSVFLGKWVMKEINRPYTPPVKLSKETKAVSVEQTSQTPVSTADFSKAAQTTVTGDYYDTALQIHLKSKENVQKLYNQVAQLAEDGKISPSEENNIKQYAHAFTMYRLIRPNSKENKAIQNLLNGGKEDKGYIENLVKKAGKYGNGVKPDNNNIKHSNFDNASPALQQQHLKNLLTR